MTNEVFSAIGVREYARTGESLPPVYRDSKGSLWRVICTNFTNDKPIIALKMCNDGLERIHTLSLREIREMTPVIKAMLVHHVHLSHPLGVI